jgi:hypothetical protein
MVCRDFAELLKRGFEAVANLSGGVVAHCDHTSGSSSLRQECRLLLYQAWALMASAVPGIFRAAEERAKPFGFDPGGPMNGYGGRPFRRVDIIAASTGPPGDGEGMS